MKSIGLVFDIDELGGGFYGSSAWRILMTNLKQNKIQNCVLKEGDTNATLSGSRREFCIAISGQDLNIEYIISSFQNCTEKGLAKLERRFLVGTAVDSEPLTLTGSIDSKGRLVVDEWSRIFHDRCKDCSWKYFPNKVSASIPKELKKELKTLMSNEPSTLSMAKIQCLDCGRKMGGFFGPKNVGNQDYPVCIHCSLEKERAKKEKELAKQAEISRITSLTWMCSSCKLTKGEEAAAGKNMGIYITPDQVEFWYCSKCKRTYCGSCVKTIGPRQLGCATCGRDITNIHEETQLKD